jgi:hypothetical protein
MRAGYILDFVGRCFGILTSERRPGVLHCTGKLGTIRAQSNTTMTTMKTDNVTLRREAPCMLV